ncbi:hypothetical protein G1H11_16480 [Phytoactinopolyspora alkaliphila]|uniref:Uncharacterized protein n=1 Tax=Phytoactinopolyspora alkaliphila TaxID=1783498 RepID=A0A6N9YPK6_9ACTN|nr:hypothetical protein [Phytoactinopolyspora alkaliphila]NED96904.1 hypothetical protein [Phytoactinopolyspora alkaliphila]
MWIHRATPPTQRAAALASRAHTGVPLTTRADAEHKEHPGGISDWQINPGSAAART